MAIDDADGGEAGPGAPADAVDSGSAPDDPAPDGDGEGEDVQKPPAVGEYDWEDFKEEYYYDEEGQPPEGDAFEPEEFLGFDPEDLSSVVGSAGVGATRLT